MAVKMNYLAAFGFILVGASSWITINGLYNELSLMVDTLPEGWEIGTYVALIIQLANISVLFYSAIPSHCKTNTFIIRTTYLILFISWVSMVVMSMTWDTTTELAPGRKHSVHLFVTTFGTATADCMTSMVFWNIASWYPTPYISMMAAGEASSGLIASILIWIQQINTGHPRYSVDTFLVLLSMVLPISAIALYLLLRFRFLLTNVSSRKDIDANFIQRDAPSINSSDRAAPLLYVKDPMQTEGLEVESNENVTEPHWKYLLILGTLSGIQNGMIPSISTYAMLPYGHMAYVASGTVSNCLTPLIAAAPSFFPRLLVNDRVIGLTTMMWTLCSAYILLIALQSPKPWGSSSDSLGFWGFIVVACNVVGVGSISCCKSCCITAIKEKIMNESKNAEMDKQCLDGMMENIGKVIQLGSFTGSIVFFVLVKYAGIFNQ